MFCNLIFCWNQHANCICTGFHPLGLDVAGLRHHLVFPPHAGMHRTCTHAVDYVIVVVVAFRCLLWFVQTSESALINEDPPPNWTTIQPIPDTSHAAWPLFPFSQGHFLQAALGHAAQQHEDFEVTERFRMKV